MAVPLSGKVVLDTNVFIDYLRGGLHAAWIWGQAGRIARFLSSVVLAELALGANTQRRRRAVQRIAEAFPRNRHVVPSPDVYYRAGELFRDLHGNPSGDRLAPMNDLLIALTAWRIGAAVITSNRADFDRLAKRLAGLRIVSPG